MSSEGTTAFAGRKEELLRQLNIPFFSEQYVTVRRVRFFQGMDELTEHAFDATTTNQASRAKYKHIQELSKQGERELIWFTDELFADIKTFFGEELMQDTISSHPAIKPLHDPRVTGFKLIMKEN